MGTPHVCFAEDFSPKNKIKSSLITSSNGSLNNNNNTTNSNSSLKLEGCFVRSPGSSLSVSPTPRYERNMGFFQQLSRRFRLRSSDDLIHTDDVVAVVSAHEEDTNSSSTDSCSYTGRGNGINQQISLSMSCASSETSSTLDMEERETDHPVKLGKPANIGRSSFSRLQRRSTSSLRRAFESLSLTSRSLSCTGPSPPPQTVINSLASTPTAIPLKSALKSASNVELHKYEHRHSASISGSSSTPKSKMKSKAPPQRILRQPVSYTYLKGMSGLPTQRVPRSSVCCQYARR